MNFSDFLEKAKNFLLKNKAAVVIVAAILVLAVVTVVVLTKEPTEVPVDTSEKTETEETKEETKIKSIRNKQRIFFIFLNLPNKFQRQKDRSKNPSSSKAGDEDGRFS